MPFLVLIFSISACQKQYYNIGNIVNPTNLDLSYEIVGQDDENLYGDGSGVVNFTTSSDNAISYYYDFGDGKDRSISSDGKVSHSFTTTGVNTYTVTVYAVGTGGVTSSSSTTVEVLCTFSDDEAVQFLSGGSSKSWYWAADQPGHLGLGPNSLDMGAGNESWPAWYSAAPWDKSASSLYDCEFVFTLTDGKLTFEQLNPTGEAFIQGIYAADLGLGDEGSHTFDIAGIKNVSFSPSNSLATIPGAYRGTTMTFSDGGFMGFYAGTSEYEIIEVTENILKVRIVQANNTIFAWYHIFTNVKPIQ